MEPVPLYQCLIVLIALAVAVPDHIRRYPYDIDTHQSKAWYELLAICVVPAYSGKSCIQSRRYKCGSCLLHFLVCVQWVESSCIFQSFRGYRPERSGTAARSEAVHRSSSSKINTKMQKNRVTDKMRPAAGGLRRINCPCR